MRIRTKVVWGLVTVIGVSVLVWVIARPSKPQATWMILLKDVETEKPIAGGRAWSIIKKDYPILRHLKFLPAWVPGVGPNLRIHLKVKGNYVLVPHAITNEAFLSISATAPGYKVTGLGGGSTVTVFEGRERIYLIPSSSPRLYPPP